MHTISYRNINCNWISLCNLGGIYICAGVTTYYMADYVYKQTSLFLYQPYNILSVLRLLWSKNFLSSALSKKQPQRQICLNTLSATMNIIVTIDIKATNNKTNTNIKNHTVAESCKFAMKWKVFPTTPTEVPLKAIEEGFTNKSFFPLNFQIWNIEDFDIYRLILIDGGSYWIWSQQVILFRCN